MAQIVLFLKFAELAHLEELQRGTLYMNPLVYFQNLEKDKAGRSDSNEGLQAVYQPDKIKLIIKVNGVEHELKDLAAAVLVTGKIDEDIHAFCLYAMTPGEYDVEDKTYEGNLLKLKFGEDHESFGGHVLCITNPKEFLDRASKALEQQGRRADGRLVDYVNESDFHGNISSENIGFTKLDKYKKQREWRLIVYGSESPNKPIRIQIGDLSDISKIWRVSDLDIKLQKNPTS